MCLKMTGQNAMWERLGCSLVASPNKFLAIGWNPTEPSAICSPGP
jgi:hypothetical protein